MTDDKPFALYILPRDDGRYGLELRQKRPVADRKGEKGAWVVVRAWGTVVAATLDRTLEAVRKNGYRPTDLHAGRKTPFALSEEQGVRLGLVLMAVKPLRKADRIDAVSRAVRDMEPEEAYYWFAKCARADNARRARRAFRVMAAAD